MRRGRFARESSTLGAGELSAQLPMAHRVHRWVRHRACVLSTTLSASMQRAGAGRWLVELLSELRPGECQKRQRLNDTA